MTKKKEVATTESNLPTETAYDVNAFGESQVSQSDVVIPKILAMQGLSELVTEGKAKFGDFVDSLSNEVIGDLDKPIEFIPFKLHKIWIISKFNAQLDKFVFDKIEDVTAANENRRWEEVIGGENIKNEKCFNFYCICPHDTSIPYIISFKSTSMKSGRELATQMFVKNRAAGKVPPAKVMRLSGDRVKNDKGTFVVLKTGIVRDSSHEEIGKCLEWYQAVNSGAAKADDSDIRKPQETQPAQEYNKPSQEYNTEEGNVSAPPQF